MQIIEHPKPPSPARFLLLPLISFAGYLIGTVAIPLLLERPDNDPKPTRVQLLYEHHPWLIHAVVPALFAGWVFWLAFKEAQRYHAHAIEHSKNSSENMADAVEAHMTAAKEIQKIRDWYEATPEVKTYRALGASGSARMNQGLMLSTLVFFELLAPDFARALSPEELASSLAFHLKLEEEEAQILFQENVGICISHNVLRSIEAFTTAAVATVLRYRITDLGSAVLTVGATLHKESGARLR